MRASYGPEHILKGLFYQPLLFYGAVKLARVDEIEFLTEDPILCCVVDNE